MIASDREMVGPSKIRIVPSTVPALAEVIRTRQPMNSLSEAPTRGLVEEEEAMEELLLIAFIFCGLLCESLPG